jgi:hypothetical protein
MQVCAAGYALTNLPTMKLQLVGCTVVGQVQASHASYAWFLLVQFHTHFVCMVLTYFCLRPV